MITGEAVKEALGGWLTGDTLILGVGSRWHGDDAVGPLISQQVPGAVDCGDGPERFLGLAASDSVSRVLLVDAVDFGGEPGEIALLDRGDLSEAAGTTHNPGLALLARYLAEAYGKETRVLGIQPAITAFGREPSEPVRRAIAQVVAWITGEKVGQSDAQSGPLSGSERQVEAPWTAL